MKNILHWFFSLTFVAGGIVSSSEGYILSSVLMILAGIAINPILINKMRRQAELGAKDISVPVAHMPNGVYWVVSFILFAVGAKFNPNVGKTDTATEKVVQKEVTQPNSWWQGGTLHNCTNAEWKAATQENKVATCSDWIISLAKGDGLTIEQFKVAVSPEQFKQMSENLAKEVDASVASGVSADNLKGECATYATMYWAILKTKVKEAK